MPIHSEGLANYKVRPDGSLEPYYSEAFEFKIDKNPLIVYKDGILKLCPELYSQLRDIKLPPEGQNLTIQSNMGPIFLKAVKSVKPLE